jgi:hypothetical protein
MKLGWDTAKSMVKQLMLVFVPELVEPPDDAPAEVKQLYKQHQQHMQTQLDEQAKKYEAVMKKARAALLRRVKNVSKHAKAMAARAAAAAHAVEEQRAKVQTFVVAFNTMGGSSGTSSCSNSSSSNGSGITNRACHHLILARAALAALEQLADDAACMTGEACKAAEEAERSSMQQLWTN